MPTNVVMEALSPTMEEGRLVEWKKQEGEPVAIGDVLAEVETDKAVMELVARAAGTMLKHIVEAGSTVPVSEPVAVIGQPGEEGGTGGQKESSGEQTDRGAAGQRGSKDAQATQPSPSQNRPVSMPPAPPAAAAKEERPSQERAAARAGNGSKGSASAAVPAEVSPGRVRASPLARRIAADRGVDLVGVTGSGPEGRVIARDLEAAAGRAAAPAAAPSDSAPLPRRPAPSAGDQPFTDTPLTQIRKT